MAEPPQNPPCAPLNDDANDSAAQSRKHTRTLLTVLGCGGTAAAIAGLVAFFLPLLGLLFFGLIYWPDLTRSVLSGPTDPINPAWATELRAECAALKPDCRGWVDQTERLSAEVIQAARSRDDVRLKAVTRAFDEASWCLGQALVQPGNARQHNVTSDELLVVYIKYDLDDEIPGLKAAVNRAEELNFRHGELPDRKTCAQRRPD